MRGKGALQPVDDRCKRITPAYAGKSRSEAAPSAPAEDHPRICGEKRARPLSAAERGGSPPHMRGKVYWCGDSNKDSGITPAYAGKRRIFLIRACGIRDHPRICGEKPFKRFLNFRLGGSPPHMRGKGTIRTCSLGESGITPAYAGKSSSFLPPSDNYRDHPRICGEKGAEKKRHPSQFWITPAYAGKSRAWRSLSALLTDHPRICGEKKPPKGYCSDSRGSPPHMRGKGKNHAGRGQNHGITPAYAGKREKLSGFSVGGRDHPRICGEKA